MLDKRNQRHSPVELQDLLVETQYLAFPSVVVEEVGLMTMAPIFTTPLATSSHANRLPDEGDERRKDVGRQCPLAPPPPDGLLNTWQVYRRPWGSAGRYIQEDRQPFHEDWHQRRKR
jgi:hypothetical protein